MARIKTLIHIHTDFSPDSDLSCEALAAFADRHGFGCLAVTDHDAIDGALRLRSMTDAQVIIGEEVTTRDGDLIGLFLTERIPPGLSARETAIAIKQQGGLVVVPHPFIHFLGRGLRGVVWELIDLIDAVEVQNAQNLLAGADRAAARFAKELGFAAFVGTDAHTASSIAPCYQMMADVTDAAAFLGSLRTADFVCGRHPLSYFASAAGRVVRAVVGLRLPDGFGRNAVVDDRGVPVRIRVSASHA